MRRSIPPQIRDRCFRVHPSLGVLGVVVGCAFMGSARDVGANAPTPVAPAACTRGERSALSEIACEIARGIEVEAASTMVALAAPASDRSLSRPDELALRFARLLAGSIGQATRFLPKPLPLAEARAAAKTLKRVVFVSLEVRGGELSATADVYESGQGFWDRVRHSSGSPLAHAFASRDLDGEIASFFPTIPLVTKSVERAALPTSDTVAVSCGDLNGDGSLELVIVGRRKIMQGRVRGHRFVPIAEVAWAALSPVAGAPLREPIGSARVLAGVGVRVGVTDRASAVELGPDLSLRSPLNDVLPWPLVGCIGQNGSTLTVPGPCARGEKTSFDIGSATDIDAIASGRVVRPDGGALTIIAFRNARDASLTLKDSGGRALQVPNTGAALAIFDVDRDGDPELLTSVNTLNPAEDALVVRTWARDGALHPRFQLPLPEGIRAITVCPPEGGGLSPMVVATDREVRVLR